MKDHEEAISNTETQLNKDNTNNPRQIDTSTSNVSEENIGYAHFEAHQIVQWLDRFSYSKKEHSTFTFSMGHNDAPFRK